MLGNCPIEVVLLATDLKASRDFYAEKLGLEIIRETEKAVWFKCGNEGRLSLSASTTGTADNRTRRLGVSMILRRRSPNCVHAAWKSSTLTCQE